MNIPRLGQQLADQCIKYIGEWNFQRTGDEEAWRVICFDHKTVPVQVYYSLEYVLKRFRKHGYDFFRKKLNASEADMLELENIIWRKTNETKRTIEESRTT